MMEENRDFSELCKTKLDLLKDDIQKALTLSVRLKLGRMQMLAKGKPDDDTKQVIISHMENINFAVDNVLKKMEEAQVVATNAFQQLDVEADGMNGHLENKEVSNSSDSGDVASEAPNKDLREAEVLTEPSDDKLDDINSQALEDELLESAPFNWETSLPLLFLEMKRSKKTKARFCLVLKEFNSFPGVKEYSGYKNFKPQNFLKTEKKANKDNKNISEFLCQLEIMLGHCAFGNSAKELAKFGLYLKSQKRILANELEISMKKWLPTFWSDQLNYYLDFHDMYYEPSKYIPAKNFTKYKDLPFFKQKCATNFAETMEPRKAFLMTHFYKVLSNFEDSKILDSDFDFISTRSPEDIEVVELDALAAMFSVRDTFEVYDIWYSYS